MLHSTLPRAFLAPGLNYLGYYGEQVHHPYTATWHIPMEESAAGYPRLPEHHGIPASWEASRPATPSPLDLSLKPPAATCTSRPGSIEDKVDVERIREDTPTHLENATSYERSSDEETVQVDGPEKQGRTAPGLGHYDQVLGSKDTLLQLRDSMEKSRSEDVDRLSFYPSTDCQKYPLHTQKLMMASPSHSQTVQNYHQQLLLTPQHHLQNVHAPMTPPSTPSPPQCPRRRTREEGAISPLSTPGGRTTPRQMAASGSHSEKPSPRPKKKHARRLKFDEDTSSPVSGTVILGPDEAVVTGDIDPAFNIVEVTEEARAELAKIENRLGPYQCKLCRQLHEDAFQLAQHRCSRIAHVEYRCPECDKRFSCPANLASHRRWHKPRLANGESNPATGGAAAAASATAEIPCTRCDAKFTRQAALRKHLATQHPETNNNNNNNVLIAESQETLAKTNPARLSADNSFAAEMP